MSHEVRQFDNVAFVGQRPWHGIGTEVTEDQARDWHSFGKLVADWEPVDQPVFFKNADGTFTQFPDYKGRFRSDNNLPLGIVGQDHTAWGNEALFAWFAPFIDSGLLRFETGGTLKDGRLVWALAKSDNRQEIVSNDVVERYLMVSNGHGGNGGTHAIRIGFTDIRIVCYNTLRMSYESEASKLIRIKHRKNVITAVDKVRDIIDIAAKEFSATAEQYRALAGKMINQTDLRNYVKIVLGVTPDDEKAGLPTRTLNTIDKIVDFHDTGRGAALSRGTLWGAFNAITEWTTWERGNSADTRLNALWFGQGAETNKLALEVALGMAV